MRGKHSSYCRNSECKFIYPCVSILPHIPSASVPCDVQAIFAYCRQRNSDQEHSDQNVQTLKGIKNILIRDQNAIMHSDQNVQTVKGIAAG